MELMERLFKELNGFVYYFVANVVGEDVPDNTLFFSWNPMLVPCQPH